MKTINQLQFIYGTAWKKQATTELVKTAVMTGFTAIDTANQPKHYSEALVGDALLALQKMGIKREQLFLQTKFTPIDSQDERVPYDPNADLAAQVRTSLQSSLEHLHTDYLDSYLLHGPYTWPGLSEADWQVWQTLEQLYESGRVKSIGISNINIKQLELLVNKAKIKPMVVQNRCFAQQGWDKLVREFCIEHHIVYQGFSLLTANPEVWQHPNVIALAQRLNKTVAQIIFRFAMQIGITPLTGTCDAQHMQQDLAVYNFELTPEEIEEIKKII